MKMWSERIGSRPTTSYEICSVKCSDILAKC